MCVVRTAGGPLEKDLAYPYPIKAQIALQHCHSHKTGVMFSIADAWMPKVTGSMALTRRRAFNALDWHD